MKKLIHSILSIFTISTYMHAGPVDIWHDHGYVMIGVEDITDQIPEIKVEEEQNEDINWDFIPNVVQYKCADWSSCIGIAHQVTINQAKEIASNNPDIHFFFYVKGICMVLENTLMSPASVRIFHQGDAVFFSGTAWWGSALGLADGYTKR